MEVPEIRQRSKNHDPVPEEPEPEQEPEIKPGLIDQNHNDHDHNISLHDIGSKSSSEHNSVLFDDDDDDDIDHDDIDVETPEEPIRHRPVRKHRAVEIKARDNTNSLIIILIFIGLSMLFVKYMDERLPEPLAILDIDNSNDKPRFIEERARNDLHDLIEVGVRVSGSYETDNITVELIVSIIEEIHKDSSGTQSISWDIQTPTGEFYLDEKDDGFSTYAKVSNVIAKLEPTNRAIQIQDNATSVLVNCHFDTKPSSPGATDNMISCATMLEILRVLSRRNVPLKNTIIFLFNGAEELGLQGAHGFVAGRVNDSDEIGHPWSKNLRTFINLEGAGGGGREILFQTGPGNGWVLKAYSSSTPRPYGLVIAEEAFQRNLIPSDTDYRIFRDFLNIPGVDMAFIKNGWIYHTKWDKLTEIPPGSIQHMGENALALVTYFGSLDFLVVEESDGKMIFFDVFGLFMIYYTETVGMIVNCLIAIIAIGLVCLEVFVLDGTVLTTPRIQRLPKDKPIIEKLIGLIWLLISTLLAWGTGILVAFIVAVLFNWTGYYKPFYSYPTMSFILFGVPAILAQAIVYAFTQRGSENRTWLAGKLTIAIMTLALTFITRVVYIFMINLLFGFIGRHAARYFIKVSPIPYYKSIQRLLIYLVLGELIPFTLVCYLTITLADVFVPILGRSGTETNPNIFFGLIVAGIISILGFNGLVSVFAAYNKQILITSLCFSVFLINPLIVFGFIGKIPFQEKTPLRLQVVDVDRIWYNRDLETIEKRDSGYWFWPVDPNTMNTLPRIAEIVSEVKDAIELDANLESCVDIFCAQPFIWTTTDTIKKTSWIPKNESLPIEVQNNVDMKIKQNVKIPPNKRRIEFSFTGPTQLAIVISPGPNYKLENWYFGGGEYTTDPPHNNGLLWRDRPTYFIYHGKGELGATDEFLVSCDFIEQNTIPGEDNPVVDILITGSFLHGPYMMSTKFKDFIGRFPSWANIMGWTAVLKIYSIY